VRALNTVCRHRYIRWSRAPANAKRFTSPIHRWMYDLDGRLAAAPSWTARPFRQGDVPAPAYGSESWYGFLFVIRRRSPATLEPRLGARRRRSPINRSTPPSAQCLPYEADMRPGNLEDRRRESMESYHHIACTRTRSAPRFPARQTYVAAAARRLVLQERSRMAGQLPSKAAAMR